jgi:glycosyltransferase involved in cell wall biosynthesis
MGAHMLDLAAEYVAGGRDVALMAWPTVPGRRLLDGAAALGAQAVALRHPRDPAFGDEIVRVLRDRCVEVFHVHVGTGRENFDGARAARRARVPAVLQTQHLPWLLGSPKHRLPFFRGLQAVDHLITVSQAQRRTYERIGVPSEMMTTVPNGIRPRGPGLGRAGARAALRLNPDQPVVLTVGRLTVMKGQRYLLEGVPELARRFPDLAVVVIGQGHLHESLRAQTAALGVGDHVHLAGHRPEARTLLDAADVFVLPSRHEGMPLALLEAMDAGLPVVATRVVGSDEVVVDGETGLLVRPQDPPALVAAIARLLADPVLRERYGAAGRRRYRERFSSARMAAETAAMYGQVLRRAPAATGRRG